MGERCEREVYEVVGELHTKFRKFRVQVLWELCPYYCHPGQLVAAKTAELFRERDLRRVRSASRDKNSGHSCRVAMEGCHKDMTQVGSGHKNIHLESKRCRHDECLLCSPKRCELDSELQKQLQYLDFLNILGYYPVCSLQLHQLVLSSHENIYFRWHTAHQIA